MQSKQSAVDVANLTPVGKQWNPDRVNAVERGRVIAAHYGIFRDGVAAVGMGRALLYFTL